MILQLGRFTVVLTAVVGLLASSGLAHAQAPGPGPLQFNPCDFGGQCSYVPFGVLPNGLGLHPTVNHPDVRIYFPDIPFTCVNRGNQPAVCNTHSETSDGSSNR